MADFEVCFEWNMDFEDPQRTFEPVPDACPEGCPLDHCYAIAGINSGAFSPEYGQIVALPVPQRLKAIQQFYYDHFWKNLCLNQLISDDLAKRVYDSGVNQGIGTAARFLQKAINSLYHVQEVEVDGELGPLTVKAANMADAAMLLTAFKQERLAGYKSDKGWPLYGNGWEKRALA